MNRKLRITAAIFLVLLTGLAVYLLCYEPYRCNIRKKAVQRRTEAAVISQHPTRDAILARQHLSGINECLRKMPQDVDLYMIAGANFRLMNRQEKAIEMYRTALQYDRRPEIYLQLGLTQLTAGKREEAFRNLVTASQFDVYNISRIPDLATSDKVFQAVNPQVPKSP